MKKILLFITLFLLVSCTTTKTIYIPVEKVSTEYIHTTDSIYLRDSIWTSYREKNDTILLEKYHYLIKEVTKLDTLIKRDTIPVLREVEKIITVNEQYWWLKLFFWIGVGFIIYLIYKFLKLIR